jgi:hypothetical protein
MGKALGVPVLCYQSYIGLHPVEKFELQHTGI